jgi:hypothetical protein
MFNTVFIGNPRPGLKSWMTVLSARKLKYIQIHINFNKQYPTYILKWENISIITSRLYMPIFPSNEDAAMTPGIFRYQ